MEPSEDKKFNVTIQFNDADALQIEIAHRETTDGLPFYSCEIDGNEVQFRKDEKWEVMWGELSEEKVAALGKEVEKHIAKEK